jgi:regulator of protease activity HflC (stomatin/prohibitin superfamily)
LKKGEENMSITVVVSAIAGLSWLVVVGILVLTVIRASRQQPIKGLVTALILSLVLAFVLNTVSAGLVFIQPDERGVVISAIDPKGYRTGALQPGLVWIVPYAESVEMYSISKQTYTMSAGVQEGQLSGDDSIRARTKDGQEVFIDSSVIYSIDPTKVVNLHITWQGRFQDEVVRPLSRGIIRDMASQYGIEEIVSTKRVELEESITSELETKLGENDLLLTDFVLRDIHFSPEYAVAVEQKQIAEQQAQQAVFVVQSKKQEAEQARQIAQGQADAAVISAEGQAKAIVIQAQAEADARLIQAEAERQALEMIAKALSTNPDLLTYNYIEKLAPGIRVMLVPNDNPYLLPLPSLDGSDQPVYVTPTPDPIENP